MLIEMPGGDYRRAEDVTRVSSRSRPDGFTLRVEMADGFVDETFVTPNDGPTAQERLDEFTAAVNEALSASRARP